MVAEGFAMNAYFMIVLLAVVLFFVVWGLGWFLERMSHLTLQTTRNPGSRAWYLLVGPGVALHESSHALGCVFTRTPIIEFKPINVSVQGDQVVLGYVRYQNPPSHFKRAIINLAPVGVSLILLTTFALVATYLAPEYTGIGGEALNLLFGLISLKNDPNLLANPALPVIQIADFVYSFFTAVAGLTVVNPIFWIIAFFAMTIMFSNAPSDVDIKNASVGLKAIIVFDVIWLALAAVFPEVGWLLPGLFELLAMLFALALGFAVVAYGFFIMITGMSHLKTPFNFIPFIACIATGAAMSYYNIGTPAFQTVVSLVVFVIVILPLLYTKAFRVGQN